MGNIFKRFFCLITKSKRNLAVFLISAVAVVLAVVIVIATALSGQMASRTSGGKKPKPGSSSSDNISSDDENNSSTLDGITSNEDMGWNMAGNEEFDENMPAALKNSPNLDYRGKTVGILTPETKPAYYSSLVSTLRKELNAKVIEIAWKDVSKALNANKIEAVVIPDANTVPYGTVTAVKNYLSKGGKLLTLGGPPLENTLYSYGNEWLEAIPFMLRDSKNKGRYILSEFNREVDLTKWGRNAYEKEGAKTVEIGDYGSPTGTKALHVKMSDLEAWDLMSFNLSGRGYKSIGFWAKGSDKTKEISIEVRETDGARWYTSIALTKEWQYFVLGPKDFKYWPYDTSATGRGDEGDTLNIKSAANIQIGISRSFSAVNNGEHEYWLDNVCFLNYEKPVEDEYVLEGFSPQWKYYPITNGASCSTYEDQSFVAERKYTLPNDAVSLSAGTQGTGFAMSKKTRFVPLIEIYDTKKLYSGCLAWMNINSAYSADRSSNGSITACFGTNDPAFYNANGLAAVLDVMRTLLNDSLFTEAGTTQYMYVDSETQTLDMGAYVRAVKMSGITVDIDLASNGKRIAAVSFDMDSALTIKQHAKVLLNMVSVNYQLAAGKPDTVMITLKKNGQPVDRIIQEMVYWSPKPLSERRYVTIANGEYMRNGKPLRIYGVNFLPNVSGYGFDAKGDDGLYHEQWWGSASYDPDKVYKQLQRVKELGFNAVAINCYLEEAEQGKNLLHFVDMCNSLGLYVDIFLYGADGVTTSGDQAVKIIELQHLNELDNIVAYDIAWERTLGSYEGGYSNSKGRKALNEQWLNWVIKNYGSISKAEQAWGESMPKSGEEYAGPTDAMLSGSNSSALVAAFRRFADEYLENTYGSITSYIKSADPYHLISSRAGAPSGTAMYSPGNMVFDAQGLAGVYDFYSPEFYDEGSGYDKRDFAFVNLYAQFAMPDSPVVWKEFGESVWQGSNFLSDTHVKRAAALASQVTTAKAILDSAISTHSTAVYWWAYNAGFRPGENSDYGVVNPDGSDRPVTKLFREYRDKFMNQSAKKNADVIFTVDRDLSASGWKEMYVSIKDELLAAIDAGKTVALVDAAVGKTTANVSGAAVGGCGKASAQNPARFVNGRFCQVQVKGSDGIWKTVTDGDRVTLPKGAVDIRVTVQNTQRSEWLSAGTAGRVYFKSASTSDISFKKPVSKNVKYLGKHTQEFRLTDNFGGKQTTVALRCEVEGRFEFATPFTFIIQND